MYNINSNLLYRILNIWFSYNFILLLSSYLPHWENMHFINWGNISLYFLSLLLTIIILLKEPHNKDIFINLSLFFFVHASSFVVVFLGDGYLIGSTHLMYRIFLYSGMLSTFLLQFFILYTVVKYLFPNRSIILRYIGSLALLVPVFVYHFHLYLQNPDYFYSLGTNYLHDLNLRYLYTNGYTFLYIIFYGVWVYKSDRIMGEYIHFLMAFFFVFILLNLIDNISIIYNLQLYGIDQYILTTCLLMLTFILIKKVSFLCTDYGQFYERLLKDRITTGKFKIQQRGWKTNIYVLRFLTYYAYYRRNFLMFIIVIAVLSVILLESPTYFSLSITAILGGFLSLVLFLNALYRRRSEKNFHITG